MQNGLTVIVEGIMKEYFNLITKTPSKLTLAFWWILRGLLIFAFVYGFIGFLKGTVSPFTGKPFDITDPLQVGANLLCTFTWEIFMLFPKKNSLRYIAPTVQTVLMIFIFLGSFGGKFLNLYYYSNVLDTTMHFLGGVFTVLAGYEIVTAMQKNHKAKLPLSVVLLCAVGFSFMAGVLWELFEFTFDQISCMSAAAAHLPVEQATGDAQHWNYALAQLDGVVKQPLIPPMYTERWPLMDSMSDIVLNTVGAFLGWLFIRIFPYNHKGKNNVETKIAASEKETVNV